MGLMRRDPRSISQFLSCFHWHLATCVLVSFGSWGVAIAQPAPTPSPPLFERSLGVPGSEIRALGESDKESEEPEFKPRPGPYKPEWLSSDPSAHMQPPDEEPQVRINPEAPGPFKGMVIANQQGDPALAAKYADQFVRYMVNLNFEVRQLSQLIGEALVRQGIITEDSWVGAEQFMNRQIALARKESGTHVSATHEMSLERITPDPLGKAEIFFFCSPTVHYCRQMGPDVERLWRVVQDDTGLRMGVFMIGEIDPDWLKTFKRYTGMTMPIEIGEDIAKALRVRFVPSLVVRAPTTNAVYSRTGFFDFEKMFQFVRKVQGASLDPTRVFEQVRGLAIGEAEIARRSGRPLTWEGATSRPPGAPTEIKKF